MKQGQEPPLTWAERFWVAVFWVLLVGFVLLAVWIIEAIADHVKSRGGLRSYLFGDGKVIEKTIAKEEIVIRTYTDQAGFDTLWRCLERVSPFNNLVGFREVTDCSQNRGGFAYKEISAKEFLGVLDCYKRWAKERTDKQIVVCRADGSVEIKMLYEP